MTIAARIKALIDSAQAASKPVWVFAIVEAIAFAVAGLVVGLSAHKLGGVVHLDELPPWRALAVFPAAGAAAGLVRAVGPVQAVRRWHGVAVRRIDERWGDEQ